MDNYQCHILINNRTSLHLHQLKKDLPWGRWKEGPVDDIKPNTETKAFVATGAPGLPSGTEGTVVYQLGDDANTTFTIYFDIPTKPLSSNTVRVDSSDTDVAAMLSGFNGGGAVESCTVKVIDGRG
jgi:hypothetical protein